MSVRTIYTETLEQFIERHGGCVNTENVSQRFGLSMADARKHLRALVEAGYLAEPDRRRNPGPNGAILEWRRSAA